MPFWRPAGPEDDDAIVAMSLALYEYRPPPDVVTAAQVRDTLECGTPPCACSEGDLFYIPAI